MGKRIWLAAICMLALPLLYSSSAVDSSTGAAPFAVVALAGHSTASGFAQGWCEGDPDANHFCWVCNSFVFLGGGNGDGDKSIKTSPSDSTKPLNKSHPSKVPARGSRGDSDFGSGVLWLMLGLFIWRYFN